MNFNLIMLPIEVGGTCILDYDPFMHDYIEKSIIACGREDLVTCSIPVLFEGKYSLHLISENYDLTDWWEACKMIEE